MELLTVQEVAALLRVSTVTVRRYIKSGMLPVVRVGHNVRVDQAAVEALLRADWPPDEAEREILPTRGVLHDAPMDVLDRYHVEDTRVMEMDQTSRLREEESAWLDQQLADGVGVLTVRSSIWHHIGMFNEPGQPDDVSENKANYLAEAYMAKDE